MAVTLNTLRRSMAAQIILSAVLGAILGGFPLGRTQRFHRSRQVAIHWVKIVAGPVSIRVRLYGSAASAHASDQWV